MPFSIKDLSDIVSAAYSNSLSRMAPGELDGLLAEIRREAETKGAARAERAERAAAAARAGATSVPSSRPIAETFDGLHDLVREESAKPHIPEPGVHGLNTEAKQSALRRFKTFVEQKFIPHSAPRVAPISAEEERLLSRQIRGSDQATEGAIPYFRKAEDFFTQAAEAPDHSALQRFKREEELPLADRVKEFFDPYHQTLRKQFEEEERKRFSKKTLPSLRDRMIVQGWHKSGHAQATLADAEKEFNENLTKRLTAMDADMYRHAQQMAEAKMHRKQTTAFQEEALGQTDKSRKAVVAGDMARLPMLRELFETSASGRGLAAAGVKRQNEQDRLNSYYDDYLRQYHHYTDMPLALYSMAANSPVTPPRFPYNPPAPAAPSHWGAAMGPLASQLGAMFSPRHHKEGGSVENDESLGLPSKTGDTRLQDYLAHLTSAMAGSGSGYEGIKKSYLPAWHHYLQQQSYDDQQHREAKRDYRQQKQADFQQKLQREALDFKKLLETKKVGLMQEQLNHARSLQEKKERRSLAALPDGQAVKEEAMALLGQIENIVKKNNYSGWFSSKEDQQMMPVLTRQFISTIEPLMPGKLSKEKIANLMAMGTNANLSKEANMRILQYFARRLTKIPMSAVPNQTAKSIPEVSEGSELSEQTSETDAKKLERLKRRLEQLGG